MPDSTPQGLIAIRFGVNASDPPSWSALSADLDEPVQRQFRAAVLATHVGMHPAARSTPAFGGHFELSHPKASGRLREGSGVSEGEGVSEAEDEGPPKVHRSPPITNPLRRRSRRVRRET